MILDNRRNTIREIADDVSISFGSYQAMFTNVLGMKNAAVKIFANLSKNNIAWTLLTTINDNPDLLKKVIAGGESWVHHYDIETLTQSSQWKRRA